MNLAFILISLLPFNFSVLLVLFLIVCMDRILKLGVTMCTLCKVIRMKETKMVRQMDN